MLDDYWMSIFENSVVEEDIGLSWYKGSPDFRVEYDIDFVQYKTISEIYEYIYSLYE